jgi:hypothetical protein
MDGSKPLREFAGKPAVRVIATKHVQAIIVAIDQYAEAATGISF